MILMFQQVAFHVQLSAKQNLVANEELLQ